MSGSEWETEIARVADEAIGDLVPTNEPEPALAALERARTAWARCHDQLDLEYELRVGGKVVESLTDDGPVVHTAP